MENLDIKALEVIEKSRGAQIGEVRTWGGKEYIKTPKGWRLKPKGYKEGEKKQELTEAGNPVGKPESVTPKKVTDQLKVGDRVMYNGKEMILTRISKDGRFQNGIEMKFVNEGDSTPTGSKTLQGNMMYAKLVKEKGSETASSRKKEIGVESKLKELAKLKEERTSFETEMGRAFDENDRNKYNEALSNYKAHGTKINNLMEAISKYMNENYRSWMWDNEGGITVESKKRTQTER